MGGTGEHAHRGAHGSFFFETGITGLFSDYNNGILGAITGLESAPPPVFNLSPPQH